MYTMVQVYYWWAEGIVKVLKHTYLIFVPVRYIPKAMKSVTRLIVIYLDTHREAIIIPNTDRNFYSRVQFLQT